MTVGDGRIARVRVDYSQYQVAAGAEMAVGDDSVPGLLRDLSGQAVAVLATGCGCMHATGTAKTKSITCSSGQPPSPHRPVS